MNDYTLLRTQRNDVFIVLTSCVLQDYLNGFDWSDDWSGGERTSSLIYKIEGKRFYFQFLKSGERWIAHYYPGEGNSVKKFTASTWDLQLKAVSNWASRMREEITAPDLWAQIALVQDAFSLGSIRPPDNKPILDKDILLIKQKLLYLGIEMNKFFVKNESEAAFVKARLEYLASALDRQGKTDWVYTAIGVFVSIATTLGVSAVEGNKFWQLIKEVLGVPLRLLGGG